MADRKITDLTALAAGSQATGDLVTIVDVSESAAADKNKKMTMENLFKGIPGDVGIGTSSVDRHLHVEGTDNVQGKFQNNGSLCLIEFEDTNTTAGNRPSFGSVGNEAVIHAAGSERLRIDDSGRLLVGTSTGTNNLRLEQSLAIVNEGASTFGGASFTNYGGTNSDGACIVDLNRSRGTTDGTMTAVASGDTLGFIQFRGADGTNFIRSAQIICEVDGTPGTNDMPGRLVFETTADGASSPTERVRIDSSGNVGIKSTNPLAQLHILNSSGTNGFYLSRANGTTIGDQPSVNIIADSAKTRIYGYGDALTFWTAATGGTANERMRIDSSGNVGIGTTSVDFSEFGSNTGGFAVQNVGGSNTGIKIGDGTNDNYLIAAGNGNFYNSHYGSGHMIFGVGTSGTERMRIDSSGRLGIGTTSPDRKLSVSDTSGGLLARFLGPTNNLFIDNDRSGIIDIFSTGTGDSLAFGTEDTEQMRISSDGDLLIGQSSTDTPGFGNTTLGAAFENLGADGVALFASRSGNICAGFNRAQDGAVVQFASAGTVEGSISISGSTTSYNGAHLARWTQLAGNAERIEILRGSVLSNLDEMCEWGEEDNEQLNRMKVSDVEGDVNVSGVFQAWDDDDDTYTNDFYCAMTGDFVIRIAQGTTVARGDLLMSAGDGTAKPQDDDIVRSKTIAKVTSTTVSTTYADGSYCVPCVLMAC